MRVYVTLSHSKIDKNERARIFHAHARLFNLPWRRFKALTSCDGTLQYLSLFVGSAVAVMGACVGGAKREMEGETLSERGGAARALQLLPRGA